MSVAYFVQSHGRPAQLLRLLAALRRGSPGAHLVVGQCPRGEQPDAAALERLGVSSFLHRRPARRGFWSLLEPYVDAVERLAAEGRRYDWLVYLSGQCYPVQPLARSEAALAAAPVDGFLTWRDSTAPSVCGRRWQGRLRYGYRYRELPATLAPLLRLLRPLNGLQRLWHVQLVYGPLLGVRTATPAARRGWPVLVGSQWTTLRRACAERVAEAARADRELTEYFEHTLCPDEAFAQTVLVNDGRFRLRNDHLRFVDLAGSCDGRPRLLGRADAASFAGGGFHFARKFDAEADPGVLDWLDREVLDGSRPPA